MISEKQVWAALPSSGFLHSYVNWASRWTGAPVGFHAVAGLCLLSQTVPTTYAFPWATPLRMNFYGLLVGPSGVGGKGRSISVAREVLTPAVPAAEMEQPGSPQACSESLSGNPQIIFYDEFGDFLEKTRAGQLAALRTTFTNLYDCARVGNKLVDRPGKKKLVAQPNPRLSLLGGVTPTFLEEFGSKTDWDGGFMSRFFTIYSTSERRPPSDFQGTAERDYLSNALAGLITAKGGKDDLFNALPSLCPCGGWATDAIPLWEDWIERKDKRVATSPPLIAGAIDRAAAYVVKIAMLLAWDRGDARARTPWVLGTDLLTHAIALTELHLQSMEEVAAGLVFDRDSRDERDMYRAIGETGTRYSQALRNSGLTFRRGAETIRSLAEKKLIELDSSPDGDVYYKRRSETSNVIQFRPPTVTPPADLF
jgi:hypothetical protein